MGTRRRLWLVAPAAGLFAADVGLTLAGQPAAYWAGEYAVVDEANPVARLLLARSPWLFVVLAGCWLAVLAVVVVRWLHPLAGWLAVGVTAAHAVGGGSWLVKAGPWGLVAAGLYLWAATQAAAWCWRRYTNATAPSTCDAPAGDVPWHNGGGNDRADRSTG